MHWRYFVPYTYPLTPGITYCVQNKRGQDPLMPISHNNLPIKMNYNSAIIPLLQQSHYKTATT